MTAPLPDKSDGECYRCGGLGYVQMTNGIGGKSRLPCPCILARAPTSPSATTSIGKAPHVPAAFINAIAEEGDKNEAIKYLQETWNDYCQAAARIRVLEIQLAEVTKVAQEVSAFALRRDAKATALDNPSHVATRIDPGVLLMASLADEEGQRCERAGWYHDTEKVKLARAILALRDNPPTERTKTNAAGQMPDTARSGAQGEGAVSRESGEPLSPSTVIATSAPAAPSTLASSGLKREHLEKLPHSFYGTFCGWTAYYVPVEEVLSLAIPAALARATTVKCPKCGVERPDLVLAFCAQEGCPSTFNTPPSATALKGDKS